MNPVLAQVPRPLRWGFLVLVVLSLLATTARYVAPSIFESGWDESSAVIQENTREALQNRFRDRVSTLASLASAIGSERELLSKLTSNRIDELVSGYEQLQSFEAEHEVSIDLLDPQGTPIAWVGREAVSDARPFLVSQTETTTVVTTSGLRTFLSVGVRTDRPGMLVVVSEPFEVNLPLSNRFVRETSVLASMEEEIGMRLQMLRGEERESAAEEPKMRVELIDLRGAAVVTLLVPQPSMERTLEQVDVQIRNWMNALLGLLGALTALLMMIVARSRLSEMTRIWVAVMVVWLVRYLWLFLEFPSMLVGGFLFDPTLYASPFGAGLASSPGEALLSALALFLTVIRIAAGNVPVRPEKQIEGSRPFTVLGLLAGAGLILLLIRAYGAALRSFVFDSTLQYVEPSEVVPSAGVVVMYLMIILLTWSLLIAVTIIISTMRTRLAAQFPEWKQETAWVWIFGAVALAVVVLLLVSRTTPFPWFAPFLVFGGSVLLLVWKNEGETIAGSAFGRIRGASLLTLIAFLLSVAILDERIHEKEEDRLRLYVQQLTRPVDAWLSFVVSESFRSTASEYRTITGDAELEEGMNVAFPLWANTLIGREGFNSALIVYDPSGFEIDRFTVGLTGYEQTELLTRLFDVNEEELNVVERRVPDGLIKYYGIWGTLRDDSNRLLGIAALLLSASEQALFRGEAPEPLRPYGTIQVAQQYQSMYLLEYQNGRLVASNDPKRPAGLQLPEAVSAFFARNEAGFFRQEEDVGGVAFETLFARDDSRPGRVVGVSLEEVGLRWHVFNLVKSGTVFLAVLGVSVLLLIGVRWDRYRTAFLGFRGRLIVAFLLVAVVPLIIFGFYNRQFAEEREEVNLSRRLRTDLDLVQQKIVNSLFEEGDFENGITDDFCEAVAGEFGVDFTIYRRMEVQSSSRSELYQAGILDPRLPGSVYARVIVAGQGFVQTRESIGDVEYAVGYVPVVFANRTLGVISVPALYRQAELEAEVAERNAFTFGVYSILLILTAIVGVVLANQLSQPVRDLTRAARRVGEGDLETRVDPAGSGEVQTLITTFNKMVSELQRSREELRRAERELAWKEMAKQVAHEIKNPLTPMKLSVQHLRQAFRDRVADLEAIAGRVTDTLTEQIDALARIATEFSSFARMPERSYDRVDINKLLKEALQLFHEVKGIEIRSNFSDTPPVIIADGDEVRRVFINIVRNAIQAMEDGGTIRVETRVESERCTVLIQDTGVGIPHHLQEAVFQPNFSTKSDGMGLGLALARKAVVDLNGTISLTSQQGKGTTVQIVLPLGSSRD